MRGTDQPCRKGTQEVVLIKSIDLKWLALDQAWGVHSREPLAGGRDTLVIGLEKMTNTSKSMTTNTCLELVLLFLPLQISLGSPTVLSIDLGRGASRHIGSPFSF